MTKKPKKRDPRSDRPVLSTRTSLEIRKAIDARAKESGKSVAHEVEQLIETALSPEGPWSAVFGGARVRGVALSMLASFRVAGHRAADMQGGFEGDAWVRDRDCYRAGMFGVIDALLVGLGLDEPLTPEEIELELAGIKSF